MDALLVHFTALCAHTVYRNPLTGFLGCPHSDVPTEVLGRFSDSAMDRLLYHCHVGSDQGSKGKKCAPHV